MESEQLNSSEAKSESKGKLIFLPEGAKAIANIPLEFIEGSFQEKTVAILNEKVGLMELRNEEYEILRELLPLMNINFKILIGIPGVDSPRSFLAEDVQERVMSYYNLKFRPETEEDRFMAQLEEMTNYEESSTTREEEDEDETF